MCFGVSERPPKVKKQEFSIKFEFFFKIFCRIKKYIYICTPN